MTQDAQGALRRIMEQYARITRFCLVCNYVTRIIEPLASRCSKFRFKPLYIESTRARIRHIADEEKLNLAPGTVDTLISTSEGDLRRAITYLQSAARLSSAREDDGPIKPIDIQEIAGVIPDVVVRTYAASLGIESNNIDDMDVDDESIAAVRAALRKGKKVTDFDSIKAQVKTIMKNGYSVAQLLSQFHDLVVLHELVTDRQKSNICLLMGQVDKSLMDGGDEELQLLEVSLKVFSIMKNQS